MCFCMESFCVFSDKGINMLSATTHGVDVKQLPHGVVWSLISNINCMGLPVHLVSTPWA